MNVSGPGKSQGVRSQTLARALDILQLLADGKRRSSQGIADDLGLHRSVVYRALRTFEDASLVSRANDGRFLLGLGLAGLAKSAMGDLEARIARVLQELSNVTSSTAIFCGPQHDGAVVLTSTRPSNRLAAVAIRVGTRISLSDSAPGLAILALQEAREDEPDEVAFVRQTGYVHTKGAPFVSLEVVAVPVRMPDGQEASLSLVFPEGDGDALMLVPHLRSYADRLVSPADAWET